MTRSASIAPATRRRLWFQQRPWIERRAKPSIFDQPLNMFSLSGELSPLLNDIVSELCAPVGSRRNPEVVKLLRSLGFLQLRLRIIAPGYPELHRQGLLLATLKTLEHLEVKRRNPFEKSASDTSYEKLVAFLLARRGWAEIRSLQRQSDFRRELSGHVRRAKTNASMVLLAHQFKRQAVADRHLVGGKRMAVNVLSSLKKGRGFGPRTLDDGLTSAGDQVLMQYLLIHHFKQLMPISLSVENSEFVEVLAKQSKVASVSRFFAAYRDLRIELESQFPEAVSIELPENLHATMPVSPRPLKQREIDAIKTVYPVKGRNLSFK